MFGKWAYGFWQCKNRYQSQAELLGVAQKYRDLKIPIDNIVQDWFWWNRKGEHVFNPKYPDPKAMIDQLHSENFHLMISVWPFFEPGSTAYDTMDKNGWFVDRTVIAKPPYHKDKMAVYDASNPDARKYYWQLMNDGLFKLGIDAWWLDTTEPETEGREENIQLSHKLAIGSGNRYVNIFPLMTTTAVYEGQRAASDQKRVFILSRSAFAGSQRNAVTAWSGDINSDWITFQRQIPAGLNYAVSGLPYWTTDIGGFTSGNPDDPAYRELFIRWFQFGTFSPIFRVHGTRTTDQNELWSYGARRAEDPHQLRPPALSPDALHLFDGVERDQRQLYSDAPAGHGFPQRPSRFEHRRPVHVRARSARDSSHGTRRRHSPHVSAEVNLVRLLDGPQARRRNHDHNRRSARSPAAFRARRLDPSDGPRRTVRRREARRPDRTARLSRSRRRLHPLRRRERRLQLRERRLRHHSRSRGKTPRKR